jgi:PhnB protein
MKLYTQLNFGGNCEEAFRYYENVLGGRIRTLMRVSDLPPDVPRPPGSAETAIIHVAMDVGDGELIGNDVPSDHFQPIRSSYLFLAVDSTEEAERIIGALSDGGTITMPMMETFFASRFAQLRDRFGVLWTVLHQRGE